MDASAKTAATAQTPNDLNRECKSSLDVGKAIGLGIPLPKSLPFPVGGMKRPWVKKIERNPLAPPRRAPGVIHLWEGGNTTAIEIKQELTELLASGYTLVEIIDSKRAEHPEDPTWWPSLMEVLAWCEYDQAFARMLDAWNHAHQLEILEVITNNVLNPTESELSDKMLKVQADFAAKVLPRIVNKGMADRVEVNQTNLNINTAAQKMSDDAIKARLAELSQNPRVLKLIVEHQEIGVATVKAEEAASAVPVVLDPTPMKPGSRSLDIPDIDGEKS